MEAHREVGGGFRVGSRSGIRILPIRLPGTRKSRQATCGSRNFEKPWDRAPTSTQRSGVTSGERRHPARSPPAALCSADLVARAGPEPPAPRAPGASRPTGWWKWSSTTGRRWPWPSPGRSRSAAAQRRRHLDPALRRDRAARPGRIPGGAVPPVGRQPLSEPAGRRAGRPDGGRRRPLGRAGGGGARGGAGRGPGLGERVARVEAFLEARLSPGGDPRAEAAVRAIWQAGGVLRPRELRARLGLGERSLEGSCCATSA